MADIPHFASPFRIIDKQALTIDQDSDDDLLLCVGTLLRTDPTSRQELPEYGVGDLPFQEEVSPEILDAIREWEPRADAESTEQIQELINRVEVTIA